MATDNKADVVSFEELPPRRTRAGKTYQSRWVKRLEAFKDKPGQWGRVGTSAKYSTLLSRSRSLKLGEANGINPDDWEFEIRSPETEGTDNYFLYVRFIGKDSAAKDPSPSDVAPEEAPGQAPTPQDVAPNTNLGDLQDVGEVAEV